MGGPAGTRMMPFLEIVDTCDAEGAGYRAPSGRRAAGLPRRAIASFTSQ